MVDPISVRPASPIKEKPVANGKSKAEAPRTAKAVNARPMSLPALFKLATDLAQQGPPVDFAKIAQVRQAIATGNYTIEPGKIAENILLHNINNEVIQ